MSLRMRSRYLLQGSLVCLLCGLFFPLSGFGNSRNPTEDYTPQSTRRLQGTIAIGVFTYKPFVTGEVKFDTIIHTVGSDSITLATPVAEHVRKATGFELHHAGVVINQDAPLAVTAEIIEFKADILTPPANWTYEVEYRITERTSGAILYSKRIPPIKAESMRFALAGGYAPTINALISKGYELFVSDPEVQRFIRGK